MKNTFNTIFVIKKKKANEEGKAPLYCRLTIKGKRAEFAINYYLHPRLWVDYKRGLGLKSEEYQKVKKLFEDWTTNINNHSRNLLAEGKIVNIDVMKSKIKGIEKKNATFLETVKKVYDIKKSKIGDNLNAKTFEKYNRTNEYLATFIKFKYKKDDLDFHDLSGEFAESFEKYLREKKGCKGNTINRYFKRTDLVLKYAVRNKLTTCNPFDGYGIELSKPEREILTEAEIRTLFNKNIEIKRLAVIRDFFVFTCLTGLSFSDLKKLKRSELSKDSNGRGWVEGHRQKTGSYFLTPVLAYAEIILKKYLDADTGSEYVFPVPSNQNFNAYLKELAVITGINKTLSTHCGRHTFGSTICADNNTSMEDTGKFLGHLKISSTQIYYRVDKSRVKRAGDELVSKLRNKHFEKDETY